MPSVSFCRALALSLLSGAALLAGCALDYEEARVAEGIAAEIPDTVMINFRHTVVSEGKVWVKLAAGRAESFGKRKEVVLHEVSFQEYDAAGTLVTEARADRAVFNVASEDATATGSILIRAPEEEASLSAGSLSWTKEGKRLAGGSAETVRLQKEDGSFVEGRGFKADFRRRRLEFGSAVRGRYVAGEGEKR
jgi:LPS export ABC transporter protein LptC